MNESTRRGFLATGAGVAAASIAGAGAGLGGPPAAVAAAPAGTAPAMESLFPPERIGIQLYSVADQVPRLGFAKLLEEIARMGYKQIEFAGYTQGTTPEIKLTELRKILEDTGLTPIGSHVDPSDEDSMKRIVEDALVLGVPNVGISLPLPPEGPTATGWAALSQTYNRFGELAAKQGVGFYLHNHFHEWLPTPDDPSKRGEDVLLAETDPRYVFFEMDIYWAHVGQWQNGLQFDPLLDYAIPHRDRYKLFHVKDGRKDLLGGFSDAILNIVDAGQGSIDFQRFFTALFAQSADEVNRHHYVWERDNAAEHPRGSMAAARASFTYIRHGLYGPKAAPAPAPVPAAVTSLSVKRTRTGRRTLRAVLMADEAVTATLVLRRGRRVLARRADLSFAAGRHSIELRVPAAAAAGNARLDVSFDGIAGTTRLPVVIPARR